MSALSLNADSLRYGKTVRKLMEAYVEKAVGSKPRDVALLLSAGVDSTVAGLAAKSLGHRVHAYTFQLGSTVSFDSKWAEKTARTLDWEWTLIKLPSKIDAVLHDWPDLYTKWTCRKKRDFECAWPFVHVYPKVKQKFVVSGLVADMHFVFSRKWMTAGVAGPGSDPVKYSQHRLEQWGPWLKKGYASLCAAYNPSGLWMHKRLQESYGLVDVNPYLDNKLFDLLNKFSWDELNKPRQKHFIVGAYPEMMQYVGHRNHQNYQLAANVDHHFEALLKTPVNFRKRGRTIDMFGDWSRYDDEAQAVVKMLKAKY